MLFALVLGDSSLGELGLSGSLSVLLLRTGIDLDGFSVGWLTGVSGLLQTKSIL